MRTGRTVNKTIVESADEFLLTREAVVRFVQDSIANAVDRQKQNADKNGRANDISFEVPQGFVTGFIGANGVGKTTIIRLIMDLIEPNDGEILIFNQKAKNL